jgi:hypothetical protein
MRKLFYILLIFAMVGCSHIVNKYRVTVDAVTNARYNTSPSSYIIKPLGDSTNDDLKFQRQSSRLIKILNQKGYNLVQNRSLAKQIIYFDYGIEKIREETRTYSEPDVSVGFSWGYPYGYYHHPFHSHFWNEVGYTQYRTYSKTYRLFNRYIVILSRDRDGRKLWRVDVSSVGESHNLPQIVPILLRASTPYIGRNIDKPIEFSIDENFSKKE